MQYKEDFEAIIPRMEAWWNGELLDRACIAVTAPKEGTLPKVPEPGSL